MSERWHASLHVIEPPAAQVRLTDGGYLNVISDNFPHHLALSWSDPGEGLEWLMSAVQLALQTIEAAQPTEGTRSARLLVNATPEPRPIGAAQGSGAASVPRRTQEVSGPRPDPVPAPPTLRTNLGRVE